MVFSSLFFIYAFLPLCLLSYALCRSLKTKNLCLLVFSLVFYTWGEPRYVLLLLLMSFFDWYFAKRIQRLKREGSRGQKKWVVFACIVNLGLIGFFKYSKMFCLTIGFVPNLINRITLPLGISFYTFQLLSYVIDVYRGDSDAQDEYWHVLLYAALFHQCIAGPIVRYKTIGHELFTERSARGEISNGCLRFAVGLSKKVIIANACGELADSLLLSETKLNDISLVASNADYLSKVPVLGLWLGIIAFSLQIYFDFSAYSDMAIGMGRMMGLHYPENFDYPYISRNAGEFWRRWHISLGSFFRDYVYIPMGGNRNGKLRTIFNLLVVWMLTGLWHGAAWNYVIWGLFWGFFIIIERLFLEKWLIKAPKIISHFYLIIIALISWSVFRMGNISFSLLMVKGMFGMNSNTFSSFSVNALLKNNLFLIIFSIVAATPIVKRGLMLAKTVLGNSRIGMVFSNFAEFCLVPCGLIFLSTAELVGASYNPFLYFRF